MSDATTKNEDVDFKVVSTEVRARAWLMDQMTLEELTRAHTREALIAAQHRVSTPKRTCTNRAPNSNTREPRADLQDLVNARLDLLDMRVDQVEVGARHVLNRQADVIGTAPG